MLVDPRERISEPRLRVDAVEARGLDQRVHHRRALAAAHRPGKQPHFRAHSRRRAAPVPSRCWSGNITVAGRGSDLTGFGWESATSSASLESTLELYRRCCGRPNSASARFSPPECHRLGQGLPGQPAWG